MRRWGRKDWGKVTRYTATVLMTLGVLSIGGGHAAQSMKQEILTIMSMNKIAT